MPRYGRPAVDLFHGNETIGARPLIEGIAGPTVATPFALPTHSTGANNIVAPPRLTAEQRRRLPIVPPALRVWVPASSIPHYNGSLIASQRAMERRAAVEVGIVLPHAATAAASGGGSSSGTTGGQQGLIDGIVFGSSNGASNGAQGEQQQQQRFAAGGVLSARLFCGAGVATANAVQNSLAWAAATASDGSFEEFATNFSLSAFDGESSSPSSEGGAVDGGSSSYWQPRQRFGAHHPHSQWPLAFAKLVASPLATGPANWTDPRASRSVDDEDAGGSEWPSGGLHSLSWGTRLTRIGGGGQVKGAGALPSAIRHPSAAFSSASLPDAGLAIPGAPSSGPSPSSSSTSSSAATDGANASFPLPLLPIADGRRASPLQFAALTAAYAEALRSENDSNPLSSSSSSSSFFTLAVATDGGGETTLNVSAVRRPKSLTLQPQPVASFYGEWCTVGARIVEAPLRRAGPVTYSRPFLSMAKAATLPPFAFSMRNFTVLRNLQALGGGGGSGGTQPAPTTTVLPPPLTTTPSTMSRQPMGYADITYYLRLGRYQLSDGPLPTPPPLAPHSEARRSALRLARAMRDVRLHVVVVASYLYPRGDPQAFAALYGGRSGIFNTSSPEDLRPDIHFASSSSSPSSFGVDFVSEEIIDPSSLPSRSSGAAGQIGRGEGMAWVEEAMRAHSDTQTNANTSTATLLRVVSPSLPTAALLSGNQNAFYSGAYASHFIDTDDISADPSAATNSGGGGGLVYALKIPRRLLGEVLADAPNPFGEAYPSSAAASAATASLSNPRGQNINKDGTSVAGGSPTKPLWVFVRVAPAVLRANESANDLQTAKNALGDASLFTSSAFAPSEWAAVALLPFSTLPPALRTAVDAADPDLGVTSAASDVLSAAIEGGAGVGAFLLNGTTAVAKRQQLQRHFPYFSAAAAATSPLSPSAAARNPLAAAAISSVLEDLVTNVGSYSSSAGGSSSSSASSESATLIGSIVAYVTFALCGAIVLPVGCACLVHMAIRQGRLPFVGYLFCEAHRNKEEETVDEGKKEGEGMANSERGNSGGPSAGSSAPATTIVDGYPPPPPSTTGLLIEIMTPYGPQQVYAHARRRGGGSATAAAAFGARSWRR